MFVPLIRGMWRRRRRKRRNGKEVLVLNGLCRRCVFGQMGELCGMREVCARGILCAVGGVECGEEIKR